MRISFAVAVAVIGLSVVHARAARVSGMVKNKKLITKTLEHDGLTRTYHVHVPPNYKKDGKHPLVLALHGGGGRGRTFDQARNGTFLKYSDPLGFVVVFPEGDQKQWSDGRSEHLNVDDNGEKGQDDVGFLSKVIELVQTNYQIDSKRVFVTGPSNGGFMSVRMALERSDIIAAVAPVVAQRTKAVKDKKPEHPISIMIINGTKDPLVPFAGGEVRIGKRGKSRGAIFSTAETIEFFRAFNDCEEKPVVVDCPDRDKNDGTRVQAQTYSGGKSDTEVVLVKVIGGGHSWPGGRQNFPKWLVGSLCKDIEASKMILEFFLAHPKK